MDPTSQRPSLLVTAVIAALAALLGVGACAAVVASPRVAGHPHGGSGPRSVSDLTGAVDGPPDVRFTLTARAAPITLPDGSTIDGLTFDGRAPGPELRVRQGLLVEVVLRNESVPEGVTLHWHGLDVPNAQDGVAGVTQDAVPIGGEHVYRFRPQQVGTFWYHSHQDAAATVPRGLFGALVVEPAEPAGTAPADTVLLGHSWPRRGQESIPTVEGSFGAVAPGTRVRARLVNTDSDTQTWTVTGAPFRVVAIDGVDVHGPTDLRDVRLRLPAGGRYDVELTAPPGPVAIGVGAASTVLGDGPAPEPPSDGPVFDPLHYGTPAPTPFDADGPFTSDQTLVLDTVVGRSRGIPTVRWTINGRLHDDLPPIRVTEGDLVRVTLRNEGTDPHPMHLHGHHALVLSRNGDTATGSPWWTDTLLVEQGQEYVVAFRADNPGIWMDHCHNLTHAAAGMVLHLEYAGVSTPFVVGDANTPE
ncbi:multicopper oxidase family protein [Pseudonocardia sp. WMMC193]|uniref:multicopper oxidase family protein n=1 Tax=Pseudonocardia sp. WMMC193 TaxID=2911965 RepID=UPI001F4850AC|nr:multicopper oxidase family protein [Pseudonocardia sp. WMMC193]MCF7550306.1 multicopper oxidase family protein [Pseudonocardia sp. WMMC193]